MISRHHTPEQQRAYSSFVTVERIADDLQNFGSMAIVLIAMPLMAIFSLLPALGVFVVIAVMLAGITILARVGVRRFLARRAPRHVTERLPRGPFDGPVTPGAPHTYLDLVRLWRDPSWVCSRHTYAPSPVPMATGLVALFCLALFLGPPALGAIAYLARLSEDATAALFGAIAAMQLLATALFARLVRRRAVTSPTLWEVWATCAVAVATSTAVAAVAIS